MAKGGMRRPNPSEPHETESNKKQKFPKNTQKEVREIHGKEKAGGAREGNNNRGER